MATNDEHGEDKSGKGFAGLSSMVSDVEAAVTKAEHAKPEPSASSSAAARTRAAPQEPEAGQQPYQQSAQTPSAGSSAGKWMLGIGALVGFIWLMSESSTKNTSPAPNYSQSSPPSVNTAPAPSYQPSPAQARPQAPTRPLEDKPSVGTNNVLGTAQIRYCLAEDIRLEAAKGALNNYVESDVDRFNAMVADYNGRCGQFRYRRGTLESARAEIEGIRSLLQIEGRNRFVRTPSAGSRQSAADSVRPSFDGVVLAIQRRLNELGYDAGAPDGFVGAKTGSAVSAFQKDQGLPVDATLSPSLLSRLDAEISARRSRQSPEQSSTGLKSETRPDTTRSPAPAPKVQERLTLSSEERQSIEYACQTDKLMNGPAAYNSCVQNQLARLTPDNRRPDLSGLTSEERQSIEYACQTDKLMHGPASYNSCLRNQLAQLASGNRRPSLSGLGPEERQSIEYACQTDKLMNGPASYNECLRTQLARLTPDNRRPNMSGLSAQERQSIEYACQTDKLMNGPAAYNGCLTRQLLRLRQ